MQEQLVQSEKMASLGVLSAGIAHEINNPINFVYAGIKSLLRDFEDIEPVLKEIEKLSPDDNDLSEKIKIINKIKEENYFDEAFEAIPEIISDIQLGADRTSEIVKGLRSFSRTEKDKVKGVFINKELDTSLLLLRNRYKNTIEVIKQYDDTIPSIEGYPGKLNQVFLNILSNAIDALEEKGEIKIITNNNKNDISIIIQDNGQGMNEETKSKIFDPFYTTKVVGQGTGLGLSISYGIVVDHKGSIKVNSEPGKGTEFIIILPKMMNHE
jgi:signal transduction histidine kinase